MLSSVVNARGRLTHLDAIVLCLVLSLAASLPGQGAGNGERRMANGEQRADRQPLLAAAESTPGSGERRTANGERRTGGGPSTNEFPGKLDLAETLSLGFQLTTNLQAERKQFQDALDDLRRQIEAVAARNAQTIATGLSVIEPTLSRYQTEGMEEVRKLNQTTRLAVGGLVVVMLVGIFAAVFIQMRGMNRFVEVFAAARQPGVALSLGRPAAALAPGDLHPVAQGPVEQATARFMSAIDRLEQRIKELEQTTQHQPAETKKKEPVPKAAAAERQLAERSEPASPSLSTAPRPASMARVANPHSSVLLGKGGTLLYLGQAEPALHCFEEVLTVDPSNTEAWVSKGLALEQMQRLDEALESYNKALALDGSITAAYLYKGGICNQLQRHSEALECYEQALRSEQKAGAR